MSVMPVLAAAAATLTAALGLALAGAALRRRPGSLDAASAAYAAFSLLGSELAVVLGTVGVALAGLWAWLGAGQLVWGQVALLAHLPVLAGLGWALLRGRNAARIIDAVTGAPASGAPRKLEPAHWWRPLGTANAHVKWLRHIDYAGGGEPLQRLDLIKPHAPFSGPRPVLINIHGGAWIAGEKGTQALPFLMHMARCGWLVIDANYRLSPKVAMPEHLIDVKRVIAWARAQAAEHGGDPDYLVLTGGSAGGHLSTLAALTANRPEYQPGFESVDTQVQGVLALYGKYDLLGQRAPDPVFERFMASKNVLPGSPQTEADAWRAMDPASHVHADAPPCLFLHGSHDTLVPAAESRWFAERLRAVSRQPVLYVELTHAQHAWDVPHSLRNDLCIEALERYLHHQHQCWLDERVGRH